MSKLKKVVTLKDIAQTCHVSINTVSHALSGKTDISEKTRQIITKTAQEMGYIGNRAARTMRSGKTRLISLIISDISNPLFSIMAKEIEVILAKENYTLCIMNTMMDAQKEYKAVASAIEYNCDGVILCPNQNNTDSIDLMDKVGMPYILFGRRFQDRPCDYIVWNDLLGGYQGTRHLIEKGHKRILYLGSEPHISSTVERLEGYKRALTESCIPIDDSLIYMGKTEPSDLRRLIESKRKDQNPFTAVFAFSDYLAIEALNILKSSTDQSSLRIEIVGFDDIQHDTVFPVNITSVYTPKKEMAEELIQNLLGKINDGKKPLPCQKVLDTVLTVR